MKNAFIVMLLVLSFVTTATAAEFDYVKLKGVDSAIFQAGKTQGVGTYTYIVDRTMGMCFAAVFGTGTGMVKIDCDTLKKNDVIKNYMDTGKLP